VKKPFQIRCEVIVNDVAKIIVITQEIKHLPVPLGKQHAAIPAVHMSKGLGQDCMAACILDSITCDNALLNRQMAEMSNIEAQLYPIESINLTVLMKSQLHVHVPNMSQKISNKRKSCCLHSWQASKRK